VIELGAALALLALPSATVELLLGLRLEALAGATVARVAGAALLALSAACWLARDDTQSSAARGLVAAMLLYILGVALVLSAAAILYRMVGAALWPAVALHAVMTGWCLTILSGRERALPPAV
jgi:hypothetical protein